jgi:hypothetical protein
MTNIASTYNRMSLGLPIFGTFIFFTNLGFLFIFLISFLYVIFKESNDEYEFDLVRFNYCFL